MYRVKHKLNHILHSSKKRLLILWILLIGISLLILGRFFFLQVLHGNEYLQEYQSQIERESVIEAGRGNIYDRNGTPLAYNELAYSVTIEDNRFYNSQAERNRTLNQIISDTIKTIEEHGDNIENTLMIEYTELGGYAFTVESGRLQRFRADIFGYRSVDELSFNEQLGYDESEATAAQIMEYLCSEERFGIEADSQEERLKIASVRYAMSLNAYQRYVPTTIARDISEETLAAISENEAALSGVGTTEELMRRYTDSYYFSHILGYTGQISDDELEQLSADNDTYTRNDIVGKAGIEQAMESQLQGTKGTEQFYVDSVGRVTEELEIASPNSGNNVYLSIDAELQRTVYQLLEQRLAGIIYANLVQGGLADSDENNADNVRITEDEVYYALIENQVLDTEQFRRAEAGSTERRIAALEEELKSSIIQQLPGVFETPYSQLSEGIQRTLDTVMALLNQEDVFVYTEEVLADEEYQRWQNGEISFQAVLQRAVANDWLNTETLELEENYTTSQEMVRLLQERIMEQLPQSSLFTELVYELLIRSGSISGQQICVALYEQGVLNNDEDYGMLAAGQISAYEFIREKIRTLEITPAQLALDPCTASSVVVDPNSGQVLALVTYPGYDNNRLANTMDTEYYQKLLNDASLPLYNNATQQRTAPGSTFKPVSAAAGLSEGVITPYSTITDEGVYEKVSPSPECWIYPNGTHGAINVSEAIRDSCNYFFYETAFRFSDGQEVEGQTSFDEQKGIAVLTTEAKNFGLGDGTGIQLPESEPQIADEYPITAAIGQSNFGFTTAQLARYAAVLGNRGSIYDLSLIDHINDEDEKLIRSEEPVLVNEVQDVSTQAWDAIQAGMEMMADDAGYFDDIPARVAGKTGTAEQVNSRPNHALFIGYAPAANPEIAIATRIAYGYASSNAAEVSADIYRYYFGVEEGSNLTDGIADDVGTTGNRTGD